MRLPQRAISTKSSAPQGAELYDGFIRAAIDEAITEDAAWYCWHASRRRAMLEACWEMAGAFVHQQIIWVKDRGVLTRLLRDSDAPARGARWALLRSALGIGLADHGGRGDRAAGLRD